MPRVLLLLPTTTYRAPDFLEAARRLDVDVTVASEEPNALEGFQPAGLLTVDFRDPEACARGVAEFSRTHPIDAVVGADDPDSFRAAWRRIEAILRQPEVSAKGGTAADEILVEEYIPGAELAVEGLLRDGELEILAVFDKPDPLEGPFFEETIYVTPSRLPDATLGAVRSATEGACRALGLAHGPIHCELRVNERGVFVIEVAARSVGGLCSRALRFGTGVSLEELILRHALRREEGRAPRDPRAAGVMMIPIRRGGRLEKVSGLEAALAVPNVEGVVVSAHPGQLLVPLPEGSRYLGFIFSRAATVERAEAALREACAALTFEIGD